MPSQNEARIAHDGDLEVYSGTTWMPYDNLTKENKSIIQPSLTENDISVISRLIEELRKTDDTLRLTVQSFSSDYANEMPTEFKTAKTILESYLVTSRWRFPNTVTISPESALPDSWPPRPRDVWEDKHNIRWLSQEHLYNSWILIPSHSALRYEWISPEDRKSIIWLLDRKPVLIMRDTETIPEEESS